MVISRDAGTVSSASIDTEPLSGTTATRRFASSGMNFEMGSSRRKRPSSWSIITPTLTMGFVIEAMRKMESFRIARPSSMSAFPAGSK